MKRYVLLFLLFLLSARLFAQPKFAMGIKTGCSTYAFVNPKTDQLYTPYYIGKFNYNFGYLVFFKLTGRFFLNSGFNWANKSVNVKWSYLVKDSLYQEHELDIQGTVDQVYLEMPVNVFYFFSDASRFYCSVGAIPSFRFNGENFFGHPEFDFNEALVLLKASAGYYLKYHGTFIFISPEAGMFVTKIYKDKPHYHWETTHVQPLYSGIDLQLQFKIF